MTTQTLDAIACTAIRQKAKSEGLIVPDTVDRMRGADVCPICNGRGQHHIDSEDVRITPSEYTETITCQVCNGTGGKHPRGRSKSVALWLAVYSHTPCPTCGGTCNIKQQGRTSYKAIGLDGAPYVASRRDGVFRLTPCPKCNGLGTISNPIPQVLLYIEDVEMGYHRIAYSEAICIALRLKIASETDPILFMAYDLFIMDSPPRADDADAGEDSKVFRGRSRLRLHRCHLWR